MNEEVPTNNVGGGQIAGAGVGPDGEPGVHPRAHRRHRRRNANNSPSPIIGNIRRRKSFAQFVRGEV